MNGEREKIGKELEHAKQKLEQEEHRIQILQNRKTFLEKKSDKARTHHLCNMGGAIQSISKEADALTKVEFFSLMEQIFSLNEVQELVQKAMKKHNEGSEC